MRVSCVVETSCGRLFRSRRSCGAALRAGRPLSAACPYAAPTGSIPAQSDDGWSGQPGASGHPLMQPDAILAAVADFKNCIERMWPEAARRGISRASFDAHAARLEPDVKIMDFVDAQPEFTKAFWDYLDLLVTDERIAKGRELLAQHAAAFDAVGARLRRRPPHHRGDLGHRDEIRRRRGRAAGDPLDRDARLRRAAAGLFQGRVSRRAGNPASRRHPRPSS